MIQQYTARVLHVNGGVYSDPVTGALYGPASSITYDVIVRGGENELIFRDITPYGRWIPDTIDTRAAVAGTPVGLDLMGTEFAFFIPEGALIDEECE
jgi:hypothetical protein